MIMKRTALFFALCLVALVLSKAPAAAQEEAADSVAWAVEAEAGASVFFGASDQTTVTSAVGVVRKSARWESDNGFSYLYGEATDDAGNTSVIKRGWGVLSTLNYRRFERVNPFAFGSAESSYEKKIDLRLKGGAGAKLTARDSETTRLDFSVALLGEQTFKDTPDDGDGELLARWSGAFALRRSFSEDRAVFDASAEYNPVFDEVANYTINAETSIAFKLSEIISLKLSVVDKFDSRAEERGARDNNDGQVLFSVLASF